ncbi:MAG: OpgC domain-containing protein [Pseudomonadota bacterium]
MIATNTPPLPRSPSQPANLGKVRDPRLDFFRGIAMFIIFIAHTPRDFWALWIPARFGFSDATEIFVFCSGMASALAFGAVFQKRGWWMGFARIVHRVWQVYWAHIGLFLAVLLLVTTFDQIGTLTGPTFKGLHVNALNLQHFYSKTPDLMIGLFTLTYVPNYFDILPMYLVILAMVPVVMGLARIHLGLVAAFVISVWMLANLQLVGLSPINFPAEPWSARQWFFNPFGWQLIFFTGFAFMRGWLPQPPVTKGLVIIAVAILLITVPFAYFRILREVPMLQETAQALKPLTGKSSFGILRYVHFLALAYVSWVAVGPMGSRLSNWGRYEIIVDVIRKVGQQSLAVFISSLIVAQFVGMIFRVLGTDWFTVLLGNLGGFAALIAVAYIVSWFKSQPWRKPATPAPHSASHSHPAGASGAALSSGSVANKSA